MQGNNGVASEGDREATTHDWQYWPAVMQGFKRTVYCTKPHGTVAVQGKTLVVSAGAAQQRVPLATIERVVLVGKVALAENALFALVHRNIPVDFLPRFGGAGSRLASIGLPHIPAFLRQEALLANEQASLELAKQVVAAKILNSAAVLRRRGIVLPELAAQAEAVGQYVNKETLRGLEGHAARLSFSAFATLVLPFTFAGRRTRPAPDPINAMLSFGYTLLHNRVAHALEASGLNPRCGFFHVGRGTHCALASDLMEDARFLVDRTVLRLVRKKQVTPEQFAIKQGECRMVGSRTAGLFIRELENTLAATFTPAEPHPALPASQPVSYNEWIMATAQAYRQMLFTGGVLTPLRVR